ncbi:hypothetical protein [Peribacillus butanolivorans]|uniref:ATP-dependent DNA ligase n=1 Tax=Peribacillus butanolivorans TaxID=421767 RepID=UPI00380D063E
MLQLDIPPGTILDGEIIVTDQGKPNFEAMLQRFQSKKSEHTVQYCVFDVIYHNGQKVTHLPLHERKELLEEIVEDSNLICKVKWMYGNGPAYFELVKQQGLEGIVQKKANSKYQIGKRSQEWRKVILTIL